MDNIYKLAKGESVTLRNEVPDDYFEVESITRKAFWKDSTEDKAAGCNEHFLAHKLRSCNSFIKELDFIAEINGQIVGNIMYTKSYIESAKGEIFETITFGPLSVLPKFQNQGIGSMLVKHTLKLAKSLGFGAVVIFGHPEYYHKFGFSNAEKFKITTKKGENLEPFMALELQPNYLKNKSGKFYEDLIFEDLSEDEQQKFDKKFQ